MDDIILSFRSREHIKKFLENLNYEHPNIKSTSEVENRRYDLIFLYQDY